MLRKLDTMQSLRFSLSTDYGSKRYSQSISLAFNSWSDYLVSKKNPLTIRTLSPKNQGRNTHDRMQPFDPNYNMTVTVDQNHLMPPISQSLGVPSGSSLYIGMDIIEPHLTSSACRIVAERRVVTQNSTTNPANRTPKLLLCMYRFCSHRSSLRSSTLGDFCLCGYRSLVPRLSLFYRRIACVNRFLPIMRSWERIYKSVEI